MVVVILEPKMCFIGMGGGGYKRSSKEPFGLHRKRKKWKRKENDSGKAEDKTAKKELAET